MEKLIPILILTFSLTITFTTAAPKKPTLTMAPDPTDVGKEVTLTCKKDGSDTATPTKYKFFEAPSTTAIATVNDPATTHKLSAVALAKNGKEYSCMAVDGNGDSPASDKVTLDVTAIPAPKIGSTKAKDGYVGSSDNSIPLTCTKGTTAKRDATEWRFFKGSDAIGDVSANSVTVAVTAADNGKKLKCQHYNSDDANIDSSNTLTIYTDKPGKPTISGCADVKVDKKLSLTCMKTGSVIVNTFEWYIGTKKQTTTTNEFKKDKAATGDAGEYYCKAVNEVGGTDSDKIKVEISAGTQELVSLFTLVVGVLLNAILRD